MLFPGPPPGDIIQKLAQLLDDAPAVRILETVGMEGFIQLGYTLTDGAGRSSHNRHPLRVTSKNYPTGIPPKVWASFGAVIRSSCFIESFAQAGQ